MTLLPTPSLIPPARRGRPRQATKVKLDQLLAGAAEVIANRGFEGATIRDVADRVGVSLAGTYYYFTSKEHLLFQIQRHQSPRGPAGFISISFTVATSWRDGMVTEVFAARFLTCTWSCEISVLPAISARRKPFFSA